MQNKTIIIRKAVKFDFDSLVALEKEFADYHHAIDLTVYDSGSKTENLIRKSVRETLSKRNEITLLGIVDDKIAGFITGWIRKAENGQKVGFIPTAYIRKEFRRRGIMDGLFTELLSWFKKNDVHRVTLNVHSQNNIAQKAWQKLGFKEYIKRMRIDIG